jgi:N-acetylglucosamine-6-phosphate deacetylase
MTISPTSPGHILDIQHNGSHGLDFNAPDYSLDRIPAWVAAHHAHGGGEIYATLITADIPTLCDRIRRIVAAREAIPEFCKIVTGIHIEGPFISPEPGYVGAHPVQDVVPASTEIMQKLYDACAGLLRLVTLAPECDPGHQVTAWLASRNITVAAGHTNASLGQLKAAIQQGLSLFTHLGNGCPAILPRHDNIIQRALSLAANPGLRYCFIPDGVHIPFFALKNYLVGLPETSVLMVTDSMTAAGMPPGQYTLGKSTIHVGADLIARAPDGIHLAGSTLTMAKLQENLATHLGWTAERILRTLSVSIEQQP